MLHSISNAINLANVAVRENMVLKSAPATPNVVIVNILNASSRSTLTPVRPIAQVRWVLLSKPNLHINFILQFECIKKRISFIQTHVFRGECPKCQCNLNRHPVCGKNGKTYFNKCLARCDGIVRIWFSNWSEIYSWYICLKIAIDW